MILIKFDFEVTGITGATVTFDNPSLKVKDDTFQANPQRFIWSSQKNWDKSLKCFVDDGKSATIVKPETAADWGDFLDSLGRSHITCLLLEGGGELAANALQAGVVDWVKFFIAPKILLGRDSRPVTGGLSPDSLDAALNLQNVSVKNFGHDTMISGFLSDIWKCY